jgi:triosephosphate isomerase
MKRLKIVAGNWKMHTHLTDGKALALALVQNTQPVEGVLVVLAPPFTHLQAVTEVVADAPHIKTAAQDCHQMASGAYTGEVSAGMVSALGAEYVILGHSERREYFGESHQLLAEKLHAALHAGLTPIFCCGEPLEIREEGVHVAHVGRQLEESLFQLRPEQMAQIVIAYEPIWAIGTGMTASPEQAQEMHRAIRDIIASKFGVSLADTVPILYGGSVKPGNAHELFSKPDVDGGLVGGASLDAAGFAQIIAAAG